MPSAVNPCFAAIDLGAHKVVVLLGTLSVSGEPTLLGVGMSESQGIVKGAVEDTAKLSQSIEYALRQAMGRTNVYIEHVYYSCSGAMLASFHSRGLTPVQGETVSTEDIETVMDSALAVPLPQGYSLLHLLPISFTLDGQSVCKDPLGANAVRLESDVHIVVCEDQADERFSQSIEGTGLEAGKGVSSAFASGLSVLTEDEKEVGVCVVDIGTTSSEIAIFIDGAMVYTEAIPVAGQHVTSDISHALGSSLKYAEALKIQHGVACREMASSDATFEVHSQGEGPAERFLIEDLAGVIESRCEECLTLVYHAIQNAGFLDSLPAGLVLTGGGSKLVGIDTLAASIFHKPVRIGAPRGFPGGHEWLCDPICSTAVGMMMYAGFQQDESGVPVRDTDARRSWWGQLRSWFVEHF